MPSWGRGSSPSPRRSRSRSRRRSPPRQRTSDSRRRSPPQDSRRRSPPQDSRRRSPPQKRFDSRGRSPPGKRSSSPPPTARQEGPPMDNQSTSGIANLGKAEILEDSTKSRDKTWKAEIEIETGDMNHVGRRRVMSVRGPSRTTREQAEDDGRRLEDAAKDGPKAVRACGNSLQKTKKGAMPL